MATYSVTGWVWAGLDISTTLLPVTITDDDPTLSPYFDDDLTEIIEIDGSTYTNPQAGTYELTFTDSDGDTHTEDLLLFYNGADFIFVPMPGSEFDDGSTVDVLGGWQDGTSGFLWEDVVCFTRGVHILTPGGARKVETLRIGDLVASKDNGPQPIAWIGSTKIEFTHQNSADILRLRPVKICKGALGAGLPIRDLSVSQQHRVLVNSVICTRMFDQSEALIAAKHLVGIPGIDIDTTCDSIEYFHFLFQNHEIVFSEGAATESLFTGPEAMKAVSEQARREIFTLFPELDRQASLPIPAAFIPPNKQQ